MKKILAIAWKDARVRFGSSSELLFFIVLPLIFTFLLAGGTPTGNEDPRIWLLVVDEANSAISQQIIDELENSTAIRPEVTTREEAQSQYDERRPLLCYSAGIDIEHCKMVLQKWSCSSSRTTWTRPLHGAPY
jgi:hypothetical protein